MSIRRTEMSWETNFVTVPNAWVRDTNLSRRARGLLVELLSHRPGWIISLQSLAEAGPEGRDALRSAITELEEAGYLQRQRVREESGQLAGVDYILTDPAETPSSEPKSDFPTLVEPTQADPTHKKTIPTEDHSKNSPPAGAVDGFEDFWAAYPRKVGKLAARKAYGQALKIATPEVILLALSVTRWPEDRRFTPHPATWLNAGRWMDETPPAAGNGGPKLPAGWS